MWPFRPAKLTDVLPPEDIRQLLGLGLAAGTNLVLVARAGEDSFETFQADLPESERRQDPFCSYFRRGQVAGAPAFSGAEEACARDEERFVRRLFPPPGAMPIAIDDSGTARHRCHMGLTDYLVPIEVGGCVLGAIVGGRRVEAEEDRVRIRKSAGKLGKLTRAEAESAGEQAPIVPADEKAREKLLHEIQAIPLASRDFVERLANIGRLFSRVAKARFDSLRWMYEDPILERIEVQEVEVVSNTADLRKDIEAALAMLREKLAFEYLAFFAPAPGEAKAPEAPIPLFAAWGLAVDPGRKLLEVDWSKLPPEQSDPSRNFLRGVVAASAPGRAFVAADLPKWLKETLSLCTYLYPVEIPGPRRAVVLYGPAKSKLSPEDADYRFLERAAKALARRYYSRVAEAERHGAVQELAAAQEAARRAEEARKAAEEKLKQEEERRRLEERTKGFLHFNFSKLVEQCVGNVAPKARELGIEFDARAVPQRLMYDGDRKRLARAMEEILWRCVARTRSDPPSSKPAPVRVFVRRGKDSLSFGAEAVGEYVTREERRQLFAREAPAPAPRAAEATEPAEIPASSPPVEGALPAAEPVSAPAEPVSAPVEPTSAPTEAAPAPEGVVAAPPEGVIAPPTEPEAAGKPAPLPREIASLPPTLGNVLAVVRRHGGRLRVDSERLRRCESDPSRWMARTTFLLELPFWDLEALGKQAAGAARPGGPRPEGAQRAPSGRPADGG